MDNTIQSLHLHTYREEMLLVLGCFDLFCHLALLQVVLAKEGYGHIETLGRLTETQKSEKGGCELLCTGTFAGEPAKVVVKVVRDSFRRRHFDEFNSVIHHVGADKGIIIATKPNGSHFFENLPTYPSRIIPFPAHRYIDVLEKHRVGIKDDGSFDYEYFEALVEFAPVVLQKIHEMKAYARSTRH